MLIMPAAALRTMADFRGANNNNLEPEAEQPFRHTYEDEVGCDETIHYGFLKVCKFSLLTRSSKSPDEIGWRW